VIAFKPYQLCPVEQRPAGIPLAYPWIQQACLEEEAGTYQRKGWTVVTDEEYADYVSGMADILTAYNSAKVQLSVEKAITDAMSFGTQCLREFSAENVLLGITAAGMTGTVLTVLQGVMQALLAGSLYEALSRIKSISSADYDGTFLNATRVLKFINKIEAYLGIPLTETWNP
jgi:hypothetical protein